MAKTPEAIADPALAGTTIVKHSLVVAGHSTSISLEDAFWQALKAAAIARHLPVAALVAEIDASRGAANLSSAIRVHLLRHRTEPEREPPSAVAGEAFVQPTSAAPRRP